MASDNTATEAPHFSIASLTCDEPLNSLLRHSCFALRKLNTQRKILLSVAKKKTVFQGELEINSDSITFDLLQDSNHR